MLSICIPTVRPGTLLATVNAIRNQTWQDWELIVVGQGSDPDLPGVAEQIERLDSRIRYIHLDQKGVSLARNAGIRASSGEWIAMTDDDCEPDPDWLATIVEYAQSSQQIHLVGGSLLPPPRPRGKIGVCPGNTPSESIYDPVATPGRAPKGWDWVGGNFAISRELVQRVGLFDECIGAGTAFPAAEDTDFKLRIEAKGMRMATTPRSVVWHTYGYRYGLQAIRRHSRNYARGNGALSAKLTLLGDARGGEWFQQTKHEVFALLRQPTRMYKFPWAVNRLRHFVSAYNACLRDFQIDPETGLLQPKAAAVSPTSSLA